jgi:hypothetical protein
MLYDIRYNINIYGYKAKRLALQILNHKQHKVYAVAWSKSNLKPDWTYVALDSQVH